MSNPEEDPEKQKKKIVAKIKAILPPAKVRAPSDSIRAFDPQPHVSTSAENLKGISSKDTLATILVDPCETSSQMQQTTPRARLKRKRVNSEKTEAEKRSDALSISSKDSLESNVEPDIEIQQSRPKSLSRKSKKKLAAAKQNDEKLMSLKDDLETKLSDPSSANEEIGTQTQPSTPESNAEENTNKLLEIEAEKQENDALGTTISEPCGSIVEPDPQTPTPKSLSKKSKKKLKKIDAAKQNDDEQLMKDELETKLSDPIDIQTLPSTSKSSSEKNTNELQQIESSSEENTNKLQEIESSGEENTNKLQEIESSEENTDKLQEIESSEENTNKLQEIESGSAENTDNLQEIEAEKQNSDEPLMPLEDPSETTIPEPCTIVEPHLQTQQLTLQSLSRRSRKNLKKRQFKKRTNVGQTTSSRNPLENTLPGPSSTNVEPDLQTQQETAPIEVASNQEVHQPTSTKSSKKEQALPSMPKKEPKKSSKENLQEEATKKRAKEGGEKSSKENKTEQVDDEPAATSTKRPVNTNRMRNVCKFFDIHVTPNLPLNHAASTKSSKSGGEKKPDKKQASSKKASKKIEKKNSKKAKQEKTEPVNVGSRKQKSSGHAPRKTHSRTKSDESTLFKTEDSKANPVYPKFSDFVSFAASRKNINTSSPQSEKKNSSNLSDSLSYKSVGSKAISTSLNISDSVSFKSAESRKVFDSPNKSDTTFDRPVHVPGPASVGFKDVESSKETTGSPELSVMIEELNNFFKNFTPAQQNQNDLQGAVGQLSHELPSRGALVPCQDVDTQVEDDEGIRTPSNIQPFSAGHFLRAINYVLETDPQIVRKLNDAYHKFVNESLKKW